MQTIRKCAHVTQTHDYIVNLMRTEQRSKTNYVTRTVPTQEQYTYTVNLSRPETKTRTVNVTRNVVQSEPYTSAL